MRIERVPDEPAVRRAARGAVARGAERPSEPVAASRERRPPAALAAELADATSAAAGPKLATRLADAGRAFSAERYGDARRVLETLAQRAPSAPAVRELHGLTLYRLGRWADAVRELEAFRSLTGSTEQHPVLADCHRALRHYDEVEALWAELRSASPSQELVAEGRIVYAGSLADQGRLADALAVIRPSTAQIRTPKPHHLRLLYVHADLLERAGDHPRARALFERVHRADPDFADTEARLRAR